MRWRISKPLYCSLLLLGSHVSNFNLHIAVRMPPGPLCAMSAGRSSAGKHSTAPVATSKGIFADANTSPGSSKQCLRLRWCCSRGCPAAVSRMEPGVSLREKGLHLPTGYSLPMGRKGEGRWTTVPLNRLLLPPLCSIYFCRSKSTPEEKEPSVLGKHITFL